MDSRETTAKAQATRWGDWKGVSWTMPPFLEKNEQNQTKKRVNE